MLPLISAGRLYDGSCGSGSHAGTSAVDKSPSPTSLRLARQTIAAADHQTAYPLARSAGHLVESSVNGQSRARSSGGGQLRLSDQGAQPARRDRQRIDLDAKRAQRVLDRRNRSPAAPPCGRLRRRP